MKIPDGHQRVMPYLIVSDAEKLLLFTKEVFQAVEKGIYRNDDHSILHAEIRIGESTVLFGQANETWKTMTAGLFIYVNDADKVYLNALANGAESVMQPETKDYGRTCGVVDPCGNTWWITSL